jgi:hypothetical protein
MKTNIIKISIFIILIASISSCKKRIRKYRIYGYIYNSIDSTPFKNTNFKLWEKGYTGSAPHETPFTTDSKGYFDITNDGKNGSAVVWPSYCECASYLGPNMATNKSEFQNSDGTLYTVVYDTIYTTPYH